MDDIALTPDLTLAAASLLRSLGLRDEVEVERLAKELVPSAETEDADMAHNVAVTRLGDWFARALGRADLSAEQAFVAGRAAFTMLDGAERWPGVLLSETPPADFATTLALWVPEPCPPTLPAAMPTQPLQRPGLLAASGRWLRGSPSRSARVA